MTIGLQTYSLRKFSWPRIDDMARELGLPMEIHYTLDEIHGSPYGLAGAAKVWGVPSIGINANANDGICRTACGLGITLININLEAGALPVLMHSIRDFPDLRFAIHNHGPGSRYPGYKSVFFLGIAGHPIGMCLDVGHCARAGEDPVTGIRVLKEQLYSVHLKDINEKFQDVPLGDGIIDIKGILKACQDIKFNGFMALEYEADADDPLPGITKSLDYLKRIL